MRRGDTAPVSLPPAAYRDAAIAAQEITQIFRAGWFCIGRSDQVKNPGDFVTLDILDQALILLRDREGTLRVLANTCRHRAARLLEGAGKLPGHPLSVPFLGVSSGGSLVSAPHDG